jgi:hypothetical protein
MLGLDISEPTVSRYLKRLKPRGDAEKAQRWLAFLNNHREVIARPGSLRSVNLDIPGSLLLVRDRARPSADPALAERNSGTLGRQFPAREGGSHHSAE